MSNSPWRSEGGECRAWICGRGIPGLGNTGPDGVWGCGAQCLFAGAKLVANEFERQCVYQRRMRSSAFSNVLAMLSLAVRMGRTHSSMAIRPPPRLPWPTSIRPSSVPSSAVFSPATREIMIDDHILALSGPSHAFKEFHRSAEDSYPPSRSRACARPPPTIDPGSQSRGSGLWPYTLGWREPLAGVCASPSAERPLSLDELPCPRTDGANHTAGLCLAADGGLLRIRTRSAGPLYDGIPKPIAAVRRSAAGASLPVTYIPVSVSGLHQLSSSCSSREL